MFIKGSPLKRIESLFNESIEIMRKLQRRQAPHGARERYWKVYLLRHICEAPAAHRKEFRQTKGRVRNLHLTVASK